MRRSQEGSPLPPESEEREDIISPESPADTTHPGEEGSPLPPDPPGREDVIRGDEPPAP
jgi:hypothetical protein